ncbi:hypothetical protein GGR56DRAFT_681019 [Xylariaceae sp. FL0804]|nr:hypothetical protein GGR56DRAFT_681019 [Xylariaceae sp. FL0804]
MPKQWRDSEGGSSSSSSSAGSSSSEPEHHQEHQDEQHQHQHQQHQEHHHIVEAQQQPPPPPPPEDDGRVVREELPALEYNLLDHKTKLFVVSGLLIFEASLLPIVLFYPLWFASDLSHAILFAIITSFFGLVSGLEFAHRSWRLWRHPARYAPDPAGSRWQFDFTHFSLSAAYAVLTGVLVGGSVPAHPLVRVLATPLPLLCVLLGGLAGLTGALAALSSSFSSSLIPSPPRVLIGLASSSASAGEEEGEEEKPKNNNKKWPPLALALVADVVAVDGGAGTAFRARLARRHAASARFRALVAGLNWFWAAGALLNGAAALAVVWAGSVPEVVAYGVGWGEPLVFATVWGTITVFWVRRGLKNERAAWEDRATEKGLV